MDPATPELKVCRKVLSSVLSSSVYVRMLPSVVTNSQSPLFADNINLYNNGPDLPVVIAELQQDVNGVHDFLNERCLHLNASKTEFMILPRSPVDLNQHTLTVGNSTLSPCSSANHLGLMIDDRLTFSRHIDLLVGKIAGKLKNFQRVRNSLDIRARRDFTFRSSKAHCCMVVMLSVLASP